MLRGRDIKRYSYEWAGLWVIGTFPSLKIDIEQYPALKQYLSQFLPRIEQSGEKGCRKKTSNKWFETQDSIAYYEEFEKEKIVYPCIMTNEILKAKEQDKNANTQELENKINSLTYKLYNLTEEEIKNIENKE